MATRIKHKFDLQRRNFLKTAAAASVTPALLNASSLVGAMMWSRTAEAADFGVNKSMLICGHGGTIDQFWRPRSDFSLPSMSAPYEDVKNEMNFIVGGRMSGGGHGIPWHRYNDGSWSSDSFDVNLGRTIGEDYPVKFLNLGVDSLGSMSRTSSGFVPVINSPQTALSQLFAGGTPSSGGSETNNNGTQSIVDVHKEAMDALRVRLGYHEKHKLDSHLTAIEEFEKRISTTNESSSDTCAAQPSLTSDGSFDRKCEIQTDIAILALKCGLTPSVSLEFGNDQHTFVMRNGTIAHDSHHNYADTTNYEADQAYMSTMVARVIRRMREEGLLDSTVITHVTDMGDARSHSNDNVALFMAGAGIKGGQVTSVSSSVTQRELFQTAAYLLGANEHPNFRDWGRSSLAQVLS
jgi:hypothetical protein